MIRQAVSLALLGGLCFGALTPQAQNREEKVRNDKKKIEAAGYWVYNDVAKGFAEAKATGKPLLVVLRCIPCEECVKLDDDLIDADERLKPLLEKFVRVRVISTNGLDLSQFQFDTDQSFAVFLMNGDGTIYGRFGTRSHRTSWLDDVSVQGMGKALEGALALHSAYPKNKVALAAKRGPQPEFPRPETFPSLKGKYTSNISYEGKVVPTCIHCHMIGEAARDLAFSRKLKLAEAALFPYPHPKTLGLILDPKESATLLRVEPGSDAQKAGFRAGDQLLTLEGQPLLSIADVQWVLNSTPAEGAQLKASVRRGGKTLPLTLTLAPGWRQRDDISWRASTWGLRRTALGGMKLDPNPGGQGLRVEHVGQFGPHDIAKRAGIVKGDVLLSVDGRSNFTRESEVMTYVLWEKKAGETLNLTLLRNGTKIEASFTLP